MQLITVEIIIAFQFQDYLPYSALLVPLCYFFFKNKNNPPNELQNKLLSQYFWWASLSRRFSSAVESKIAQDLKRIDMILAGKATNL